MLLAVLVEVLGGLLRYVGAGQAPVGEVGGVDQLGGVHEPGQDQNLAAVGDQQVGGEPGAALDFGVGVVAGVGGVTRMQEQPAHRGAQVLFGQVGPVGGLCCEFGLGGDRGAVGAGGPVGGGAQDCGQRIQAAAPLLVEQAVGVRQVAARRGVERGERHGLTAAAVQREQLLRVQALGAESRARLIQCSSCARRYAP